MANALTALRLLLVIPFAFFMARGDLRHAVLALLAMVLALATDFLDGAIARRTGTASALGGTFDHTSDFLFVTCGLFAGALRGAFPWILPILITAAFAQYVIDSYWIHVQSQTGSGVPQYLLRDSAQSTLLRSHSPYRPCLIVGGCQLVCSFSASRWS